MDKPIAVIPVLKAPTVGSLLSGNPDAVGLREYWIPDKGFGNDELKYLHAICRWV